MIASQRARSCSVCGESILFSPYLEDRKKHQELHVQMEVCGGHVVEELRRELLVLPVWFLYGGLLKASV